MNYTIGNGRSSPLRSSVENIYCELFFAECKEYSSLVYVKEGATVLIPDFEPEKVSQCVDGKKLIIGGVEAEPMEFPHAVSYW